MNENFEDRDEVLDTVRRFERMVAHNEPVFFDLADFENIIDHYTSNTLYDKALQACEAAIAQYPFSTELLIDRSQVLAMKGEYIAAAQQIEDVAQLDPDNPDVAVTRGIIATQKGQFSEAVAFFQQAVERAPDRDDIYFNLGLAYQSWQKFKSAAKYYKQSLRLNPDNDIAVQELLYCLEVSERLEKNLDFFRHFTDQDPYSALAWYNLGQAYYRAGKYDEAVVAFEYAILIDAKFYDAHGFLASTYVSQLKYREGIEEFKLSYAEGEPTAEALCNIGECHEKLAEWDQARRNYQRAIDLEPDMDEAWFGIGIVLNAQERWFEAIHFFRKAVSLYEESVEYWLALAAAEYQVGNVVSAIEAYERASQVAPDSKDAWLNWSIILYEQGNFEGAIDLMRNAVEIQPGEAELHYRLCAYLLAAGRYREAYQYLENALVLDFDKHRLLFEFFPELESQRALTRLIEQYRK
ncbi:MULTISPECIES: tetratricopeptide repeat protein [Hymenobacter]|uniref:Tetratricopeptide repeat protein n=1 Tax=Hymenobacter jejuensis TaxID=2502781 RepID=A0A5B8A3B9_9BACT|nr:MULTISPECIES: tetratricopeptide repeat protein [Hymenobacter]MBC6990939.1 tetratricopeptide repeat protein [Hymenobacter sp. BT491]QDA60662.1 tetratricopeptide repeat protein [Hymenobacter jejuensis]